MILIDNCGKLPQRESMSQSIRISDELAEVAKQQAALFHRSPPQQIEHWAAIGRVMEVALSYPAEKKMLAAIDRKKIDEALSVVGSSSGIKKAQAEIQRTSANIVSQT